MVGHAELCHFAPFIMVVVESCCRVSSALLLQPMILVTYVIKLAEPTCNSSVRKSIVKKRMVTKLSWGKKEYQGDNTYLALQDVTVCSWLTVVILILISDPDLFPSVYNSHHGAKS